MSNSNKLRFMLLLSLILVPVLANAQFTVQGKVTDANDGAVLPGVNISIKDTNRGTSTDSEGNYSLIVNSLQDTLLVSFIGYNETVVPIDGRTTVNISLESAITSLENILVIGYGTTKQEDFTGSISSISSTTFQNESVNSLQKALQGHLAGVSVNTGGAKLGQSMQVRIRGSASVTAGNQPLYVIDGIPVYSENISTVSSSGYTNPLASINMNNIESISILKDASAAAIYGSRASNGVVLITTKSGHDGKARVNISYETSTSTPSKYQEFLNAEQFVRFFRQSAEGGGKFDYRRNPGAWTSEQEAIDYYVNNNYIPIMDEISEGNDWRNNPTDYNWSRQSYQKAVTNKVSFDVSGGDNKTTYFISGLYSDEEGILLKNKYLTYSGRMNLKTNVTEKFQVGMRAELNRVLDYRLPDDNQFATPMQMNAQAPISPFFENVNPSTSGYQPGTEYNTNTYYYNNLDIITNSDFITRVFHTIGSIDANYNFSPNLSFNSQFGMDLIQQNEERYSKPRIEYYTGAHGTGYNAYLQNQNYSFTNTLTYDQTLASKHDLNVVVGNSFNWHLFTRTTLSGENFPDENFTNLESAALITGGGVRDIDNGLISYFSRAKYIYNSKYILELSGRVDGSSRFGKNNKYGFFPAASAGWNLMNEDFMSDVSFLSGLKLRASYGVTGNSSIGDYLSLGLYNGVSYAEEPVLVPIQVENPDLRWETTRQMDFGIDYSLFNDRVFGEIDYYSKVTDNLLLNVNVPGTTGFRNQLRNIGELTNHGFEFTINTINIQKSNFLWTTQLNLGLNRNNIKNLGGQVITHGINRAIEGSPIGVFYGYEYAGVNPANGDALYYLNSEPNQAQITNNDVFKVSGMFDDRYVTNDPNFAKQVVIGNPNPTFEGGFNNKFSYKNLEFNAFFQYRYGNKIYNVAWYQEANGYYYDNQLVSQLRAWKNPGDITDVPEARLYWSNGTSGSSRYIQDGSYIRLKNVRLTYTLPEKFVSNLKLNDVRVYLLATNLLTFTNYEGTDPEVNTDMYGDNNLALGKTFYSAPQPRTFSFGITIGI